MGVRGELRSPPLRGRRGFGLCWIYGGALGARSMWSERNPDDLSGAQGGRKGSALLADEGGLESRSLETVKRSGEKRACKGRAAGANGGELLSSSSEGRAEG